MYSQRVHALFLYVHANHAFRADAEVRPYNYERNLSARKGGPLACVNVKYQLHLSICSASSTLTSFCGIILASGDL